MAKIDNLSANFFSQTLGDEVFRLVVDDRRGSKALYKLFVGRRAGCNDLLANVRGTAGWREDGNRTSQAVDSKTETWAMTVFLALVIAADSRVMQLDDELWSTTMLLSDRSSGEKNKEASRVARGQHIEPSQDKLIAATRTNAVCSEPPSRAVLTGRAVSQQPTA